jgi:hypothetical protein
MITTNEPKNFFLESGEPDPGLPIADVFWPMDDFIPPGVYLGVDPETGCIQRYYCDERQILRTNSCGQDQLLMEQVPDFLVTAPQE